MTRIGTFPLNWRHREWRYRSNIASTTDSLNGDGGIVFCGFVQQQTLIQAKIFNFKRLFSAVWILFIFDILIFVLFRTHNFSTERRAAFGDKVKPPCMNIKIVKEISKCLLCRAENEILRTQAHACSHSAVRKDWPDKLTGAHRLGYDCLDFGR